MDFEFEPEDFLKLDKMIIPKLLRMLYVIVGGLIILAGLISFTQSVLLGLVVIIVGLLSWRINCEIVIIIFNIYDKLASIDNKMSKE